ncbi:MAG TPA: glycosyltransferase family 2 protein, partial [Candidatus Saccharimonadales bacterium]|nr:glycosyltransferase family 2 protein [Candidatus Saccharimonadales bacterium]
MKLHPISIIIPVLNEQDTVQALVERIAQTAFLYTFAYEIIFVDDHSTDKTREIITNLAIKYPVYLHTKQGKRGKNQSLLEGFSQAQYDVLCMIDGDLQYPPENLPKMMEKIENGADIVVANRKKKRFSDLFLYRFLHNLDCDVQSGLKVFRKEVFMKVSQDRSSGSFDLNFLVNARRAGFVIAAHPITFYPRYIGKSKESIIKKSVATGWTALKLLPYKRLQYTNVIFPSFAFISVFLFALWWFSASHIPHNFSGNFKIFDILLFILVSYIIWHPIIMEVLTWSISSHIKETNV